MGAGESELRKWHSNVPELKSSMTIEQDDVQLTYTNWTTGRKQHETKILSVTWNKQSDKITIDFNSCLKAAEYNTKRMLLPVIYSIHDILGLASPVAIIAKLLYSEICLKVWLGRSTTGRHHKTMESMDQASRKDERIHTTEMCHRHKAQRNLSTLVFDCK